MDDKIISAYFAVFLYPAVMLLIPEPITFRWWLHGGSGATMPPDVARRAADNESYLMLAKFVILIAGIASLRKHSLVSVNALGFRPANLTILIAGGLAAGLIFCIWMASMKAIESRIARSEGLPFLLREPVWKISVIIILGAFAEEYWRGLSLYLLRRENVTVGWALVATSTVFGVGHVLSPQPWSRAMGRILSAAIAGAFLGCLFIEFQTVLVPFITHVTVNSFGAIWGRRRLTGVSFKKD